MWIRNLPSRRRTPENPGRQRRLRSSANQYLIHLCEHGQHQTLPLPFAPRASASGRSLLGGSETSSSSSEVAVSRVWSVNQARLACWCQADSNDIGLDVTFELQLLPGTSSLTVFIDLTAGVSSARAAPA